MLLNLLRVENADPEYMISRSFFQYQHEMKTPRLKEEIEKCKEEIDAIRVENEKVVYQMKKAIAKLEAQIRAVEMTPKYLLPFLQNGRLIHVKVVEMKGNEK